MGIYKPVIDISGNAGSATKLANDSGAAPSYSCRAWVAFNGTGTVGIRSSGNVSSLTDNGTGDYTANFAIAMLDTNYSVIANARGNGDPNRAAGGVVYIPNATLPTTSGIRFGTYLGSSAGNDGLIFDQDYIFVSVFR